MRDWETWGRWKWGMWEGGNRWGVGLFAVDKFFDGGDGDVILNGEIELDVGVCAVLLCMLVVEMADETATGGFDVDETDGKEWLNVDAKMLMDLGNDKFVIVHLIWNEISDAKI